MDGSPPAGWRYTTLEELADVVSGGTPSRATARYWGGSIPWATPTEVSHASVRYLDSTRESITEAGVKAAGLRVLPAGSVLVTTRATIGAVARARVPVTTNQGFQNLVPHADTDAGWLFHAIEAARPVLHSLAAGSTFKEVSRESFRKLRLLVAPQGEQRAIAGVLDAVDEAIERTEAAIAATEVLRRTLLHELLTHGVPGWHTKWRTALGIGTIPACWLVSTLGELCAPPQYGAGAPSIPFDPHLPRYVRITDISDEGRLIDVDPRSADPSLVRGYDLHDGDLLFARSGATVGKTYLHSDVRGPCVFAGYLIRFQASRAVVRPDFLLAWTRTDAYRRWVESILHAGAQPNINAAEYSALPVPCPPMREQERILPMTSASQVRLDAEDGALAALRLLKSAASTALLTGSVRAPRSTLPAWDNP